MIKLSGGEAKKLADVLQNLARPSSAAEKADVLRWIKFLRADK